MIIYRTFFCSLALGLMVVSCSPTTPAQRTATITSLKNIDRAMRLLEEANHASIGEQLQGISGGKTLQEKWELLLIDDAGRLMVEKEDIRKHLCRDNWGNRFNVDYKTNLVAHAQTSSVLLETSFDVVIWSSGQNGINEFGHGDDVFLPVATKNK